MTGGGRKKTPEIAAIDCGPASIHKLNIHNGLYVIQCQLTGPGTVKNGDLSLLTARAKSFPAVERAVGVRPPDRIE